MRSFLEGFVVAAPVWFRTISLILVLIAGAAVIVIVPVALAFDFEMKAGPVELRRQDAPEVVKCKVAAEHVAAISQSHNVLLEGQFKNVLELTKQSADSGLIRGYMEGIRSAQAAHLASLQPLVANCVSKRV